MKIEPAEQFAGKTAHALRPHGYGENVEALIAEHAPLVRKIAWQVHSRAVSYTHLDVYKRQRSWRCATIPLPHRTWRRR